MPAVCASPRRRSPDKYAALQSATWSIVCEEDCNCPSDALHHAQLGMHVPLHSSHMRSWPASFDRTEPLVPKALFTILGATLLYRFARCMTGATRPTANFSKQKVTGKAVTRPQSRVKHRCYSQSSHDSSQNCIGLAPQTLSGYVMHLHSHQ